MRWHNRGNLYYRSCDDRLYLDYLLRRYNHGRVDNQSNYSNLEYCWGTNGVGELYQWQWMYRCFTRCQERNSEFFTRTNHYWRCFCLRRGYRSNLYDGTFDDGLHLDYFSRWNHHGWSRYQRYYGDMDHGRSAICFG